VKKAMILTVGIGHGVESGIAASIRQNNPDFIMFLATNKSKETIRKVEEILRRKLRREEYDIKIISREDDAEECYKIAKDAIKQLKNNYYITVDFTSGTKAMTGGVILAAVIEGVQNLVYITGQRDHRTGRVISGTERIYAIPSPLEILTDLEKRRITHMFNNYQFYDCLRAINDLKRNLPEEKLKEFSIKALETLVKAYYLWDLFRHKEAFNELVKLKSKEVENLVSDISQLNANKEFLGKLIHCEDWRDKLLLTDIICNAERRMQEGKHDDAVARLYRATEFIGQIALKQRGIDLETMNLQTLPIDEEKKRKYEKYVEKGKMKLGLRGAYELLEDLGHPIGQRFHEDKALQDLLRKRNDSILAHGVTPVDEADAKKLYNRVVSFANAVFSEIESWIKRARFVRIR